MAHTRYADDVTMLSSRHSKGCLSEAFRQAYSVPFDTTPGEKEVGVAGRGNLQRDTTRPTDAEKVRDDAGHGHQTGRNCEATSWDDTSPKDMYNVAHN